MAQAKRMTPYREFVRFRVYRLMQPWGDDWDQAAMIAASVCNRLQKKANLKLEQFRPTYKRRKTDDEIEAAFRQFFGRLSKGANGDARKSGD